MKRFIVLLLTALLISANFVSAHEHGKKRSKKKGCCVTAEARAACVRDANGNLPACCTKNKGKNCSKDCPARASAQPSNPSKSGGCGHGHEHPHEHSHPHN
ncbi:MAG: hypothetical protein RMJ53_07960 [Chitinophagales bacterium]|nr:hypothetical protein [Chitinophagales bacterium]MDW8274147.1 hypothetical protein [Chitinophagales bacterium]